MIKQQQNWLVSVRCYTYNQALYIKDAMNGFTMQQTDFPFVCCIVDDASTDNEQDVILKYIENNFDYNQENLYKLTEDYGTIIFARHKTNKNCYFAAVLLSENHNTTPERKALKRSYISQWEHTCKYEALCEGDDYWIDPLKLQKQVDFLESHPDYSMCFHNAVEHFENRSLPDRLFSKIEDKDYSGTEIYQQWIVPTASVMLKIEAITCDLRQRSLQNRKFIFGDIIQFLSAAHIGKVHGMSAVMSVYRRHDGGVTSRTSVSIDKRIIEHHKEIPKVFGHQYWHISKLHISNLYMAMRNKYRKDGRKAKAFGCLLLSLRYDPAPFVIILKGKYKSLF